MDNSNDMIIGSGKRGELDFSPGMEMHIQNETTIPRRCRVEFGDYGYLEFDSLQGATLEIHCGIKPPKITFIETDHKLGVVDERT